MWSCTRVCSTWIARMHYDVHTHANVHRLTAPNLLRISRTWPARGTRPMKGISARVVHNCSRTVLHMWKQHVYVRRRTYLDVEIENERHYAQSSILTWNNLSCSKSTVDTPFITRGQQTHIFSWKIFDEKNFNDNRNNIFL